MPKRLSVAALKQIQAGLIAQLARSELPEKEKAERGLRDKPSRDVVDAEARFGRWRLFREQGQLVLRYTVTLHEAFRVFYTADVTRVGRNYRVGEVKMWSVHARNAPALNRSE